MKRKINKVIKLFLILSSICTMSLCLWACKSSDVTVDENSAVMNTEETASESVTEVVNELTVEQEDSTEPAPEPTPDPTPEPTPETVTYEGIDMESTLPGEEWIKTFVGIIDEPKVVIFNDETGRKEIIENGDIVTFNPDIDFMAIYMPEGTKAIGKTKGIIFKESYANDGCGEIYKLDAVKTRNNGRQMAALYVEVDGEEVALTFDFRPE